ncbi:MAG TPA: methyltransferase domain-containing protein [Chloroflexia bacterium]|nr:methyltransferase domain-containing protein [Chloroflexia bacterium]
MTGTKQDNPTPLARYGVRDADEERDLRAKLRDFYERTLTEGQGAYFNLEDGKLVPTRMGRHWLAEHIRLFTRLFDLQKTDRFLDVGCGEGYYTMALAKRAGITVGIDLSSSVLRVFRGLRGFPSDKIWLVNSDVERLPFEDASFDKALCSHVLEHVLDDRAVLSEIYRVLREGGRAILAVPLKYTPQHKAIYWAIGVGRAILKPGKKGTPMPPPGALNKALVGKQAHIRHHSLRSFVELVESEGFKVEAVKGVWFHDPRNWLVRKTQPLGLTYKIGTAISKLLPGTGAGLVVVVRK